AAEPGPGTEWETGKAGSAVEAREEEGKREKERENLRLQQQQQQQQPEAEEEPSALETSQLPESGETMHAAGLHAIADIMTSEAVLIANRRTASPELVRKIATRRYVYFTHNVHVSKLPEVVRITPGRRAPTISPLDDSEWRAVGTMVEKDEEAETLDKPSTARATDIMVFGIQNCRYGETMAYLRTSLIIGSLPPVLPSFPCAPCRHWRV
ncbi:MAG: HisG, C-terminal domain-containing protein, partial [Olpidium bornovanus]